MSKYYEWESFKNLYLEDSFVLRIENSEKQIVFTVELVLSEEHPKYSPPNQGDQYCYKKATIIFGGLKSTEWIERNSQSFIDADNSKDFGNIDVFEQTPEGYHLSGDWGEVKIDSNPPALEWV